MTADKIYSRKGNFGWFHSTSFIQEHFKFRIFTDTGNECGSVDFALGRSTLFCEYF